MRPYARLIALATVMLFVFSIAEHGALMGAMVKATGGPTSISMHSPAADCDGGCPNGGSGMQMACFAQCATSVGILLQRSRCPRAHSLGGRPSRRRVCLPTATLRLIHILRKLTRDPARRRE